MPMAVIPQGHPLRSITETFIRNIYCETYVAKVDAFAPTLVAVLDGGEVQCAAGLRFEDDGFFSERYLDRPVDQILTQIGRCAVWRGDIFEVTSLASRSPADVPRFLRDIAEFGMERGFEWAFFTATEHVQRLLARLRFPVNTLSRADPARIGNPAQWGSYYSTRPVVLAASRESLASPYQVPRQEVRHAWHP
jgi:hypothetical protein